VPAPADRTSVNPLVRQSTGRESGADLLPWQYSKPGQLRMDYAVDAQLRQASVPGNDILQEVRPPVPQQLFPNKWGYWRRPLTIYDVLATDRWAPTIRSWVSGAPALGNPRNDERPPYAEAGHEAKNATVSQGQAT
jgi:hypothetical protein